MEGIPQPGLRSAQNAAQRTADIRWQKSIRPWTYGAPGSAIRRGWPRARAARARAPRRSQSGELIAMLVPIILSGGAGTRLWPLSRELYPKQLLPLIGRHTMLQETVRRLTGLDAAAPTVVSNEAHRFLVAEQLREIGCTPRAILLEPQGRNTAPAIALAAHAALAADEGDPLLLVLPADHVIRDTPAFQKAVAAALPAARDGALVTFGGETGYGYIQRGKGQGAGFGIVSFVEKPAREKAEQFVLSGDYYWNSGMFLFRARRYLEELEEHAPDIASVCRAAS